MDELTMLIRVVGGESEAVERLRAAGFRAARDLARADVDEICDKSGLTPSASSRLQRAAREAVESSTDRGSRFPRDGFSGFPEPAPGQPEVSRWSRGDALEGTRHREGGEKGVTLAEASALATETPIESEEGKKKKAAEESTKRRPDSFWRFG